MHILNRFSWFPSWESSFWYYAAIIGLAILSVLIKQTCIFIIWCIVWYLFSPRRAVLVMIGIVLIFFLSFTPFLPDGAEAIYRNVLTYSGGTGNSYGLSNFFPRSVITLIALTTLALMPIWFKSHQIKLIDALRISGITTIVLLPGFGAQYATLLLAPACFKPNRWLIITCIWFLVVTTAITSTVAWESTAIATTVEVISYSAEIIGYVGLWASAAIWLVTEFVGLKRLQKSQMS